MAGTTGSARGAGAARARSALGAHGEALAAGHLADQGMVVLDRNWRCDIGEVDLVLRDADTLVVCEVKTRRSTSHGTPLEAVTEQKAERLRRLGARWLLDHGVRPHEVRIDLVGIICPQHGQARIDHVRGVA